MNYSDYLFNIKEGWSNNTVLIDAETDRSYTYRELQNIVRSLGSFIKQRGYRPGEVISTHLHNSAEAVIAHLAIQYAGCVTCLLDPLITAKALSYYLKDTNSKCLFTHLRKDEAEANISREIQIINTHEIENLWDTALRHGSFEEAHNFAPDQLAVIFYTSGTTSQPKGVMLSPQNFWSHYKLFNHACYQYEAADRLLCFVPFSHGYGSKSIFIPCLMAGAAIVMMRSFHPYKVIDVIEKQKISHIFGVPSHFQQLLRKEELTNSLKKLKAAFSAAALLKLETARDWKEKIGFYLDEGYGLIETCTGVAFRIGKFPERLGHIGNYPADLIEIEIMDDDGNFLEADERGEIVVRGESVMLGYLNKREETERVLQNGWFRTGDLGYKTREGELFLSGRIKDVINVAGIKVAPFEIEAVLNEHHQIVESAVVGVDDETYGEVVKAFVKIKNSVQIEERDLKIYLQDKLINFQIPKEIVFIEEFPRNNMGKIDKNALRSM